MSALVALIAPLVRGAAIDREERARDNPYVMRAGAYLLAASLLFGCGARSEVDGRALRGGSSAGGGGGVSGSASAGGEATAGAAPMACAATSNADAIVWTAQWKLSGAVGVTTDGLGRPLLEINGPKGEVDLFKLDRSGETLWAYSFEGNGRFPVSVVLATNRDGHSVVLSKAVHDTRLRPFAAFVEATGAVRWRVDPIEIADRYWDPMTVALGPTGSATAVGFADEPIDVGGGALGGNARHAFVFQLDEAGKHVWSLGLGGLIDMPELASFADGSLLLAGTLTGRLAFAGTELTSKQAAPFIIRLSPSGQVVFARVFATREPAALQDLAVTHTGGIYVAVSFTGELDLGSEVLRAEQARTRAIVKFAANGQREWAQVLGANVMELSLAASETNELVMAAGFRDTVTVGDQTLSGGSWSTFAAKLSDSGRLTWHQQWLGAPEASPEVAADPCGGVFAGVTFRHAYDTGREVLMNMRPPPGTPIERYVTAGVFAAALLHFSP